MRIVDPTALWFPFNENAKFELVRSASSGDLGRAQSVTYGRWSPPYHMSFSRIWSGFLRETSLSVRT